MRINFTVEQYTSNSFRVLVPSTQSPTYRQILAACGVSQGTLTYCGSAGGYDYFNVQV